jgi:hypothetical protein
VTEISPSNASIILGRFRQVLENHLSLENTLVVPQPGMIIRRQVDRRVMSTSVVGIILGFSVVLPTGEALGSSSETNPLV